MSDGGATLKQADGQLIVTLDGPAGVGKTTLAKRLAGELGVAYLDTGAMYRATALFLGEAALSEPEETLRQRLRQVDFDLKSEAGESILSINGKTVSEEIRTEQVGAMASKAAALPAVREFLSRAQQAVGARSSLVAEGRDMGSVVFPQARHKFFLDAAPEVRAKRRFEQLMAAGREADLEQITEELRERDHRDRTRAIAPLRPADDAVIIDTGRKNVEQVFHELLKHVRST